VTLLAVTTGEAVLAWIGIVLLLVVAVLVLVLLDGLRRPVDEIDGYASHILDAGVGIATNLDGVDDLVTTHKLATAVPGLAVAYLEKAGLA